MFDPDPEEVDPYDLGDQVGDSWKTGEGTPGEGTPGKDAPKKDPPSKESFNPEDLLGALRDLVTPLDLSKASEDIKKSLEGMRKVDLIDVGIRLASMAMSSVVNRGYSDSDAKEIISAMTAVTISSMCDSICTLKDIDAANAWLKTLAEQVVRDTDFLGKSMYISWKFSEKDEV